MATNTKTGLCGALLRPGGINFRLLQLAADGVVVDGFTTEIAGMEFIRNALDGLGGVRYGIELIEEFLDGFGALFDPDNVATSPIGRSLTAQTWLHNKPIGEVVYQLTGRTREELLEGLPEQLRVVSGESMHTTSTWWPLPSRAAPTSSAAPTAGICPKDAWRAASRSSAPAGSLLRSASTSTSRHFIPMK